MQKKFVVCATNFTDGGPLTILRELLTTLESDLDHAWDIVAIVHDARLVPSRRIQFIELPGVKQSWFRRVKFEWLDASSISRELKPDLWLSLHDITPNVGAVRQAVYCHNPAPFFRITWRDAWLEPKFLAFNLAYKLLYRINIKKNQWVVVQQDNLRKEFSRWVGRDKIVVAYPSTSQQPLPAAARSRPPAGPKVFVYPAVPRTFKNVELLCKAVQLLESNQAWNSSIVLTIQGQENRYARWLFAQFGQLRSLSFAGLQSRKDMQRLYERADCLLFPSRLETWGLPITEAKARGLPIFAADLPYARETVGTCDAVDFIDTTDPRALATKLMAFQNGVFRFSSTQGSEPASPFARDWSALVSQLIRGL